MVFLAVSNMHVKQLKQVIKNVRQQRVRRAAQGHKAALRSPTLCPPLVVSTVAKAGTSESKQAKISPSSFGGSAIHQWQLHVLQHHQV